MGERNHGADARPRAASSTSIPLFVDTYDPSQAPDISDLSRRLRFCPKDGRIWLDEQRMLLLHLSSLSGLRGELIDSLGIDLARGLLTRMGYASGSKDARLARKVRARQSLLDAFLVGPQLHALEGIVSVEPVRLEADVETGRYYGEFIWHDSSEVDAHIAAYGMSSEPVCWMQIGYACGYTSVFMGRPILYREIECRAAGSRQCRIIGKPVEQWDDPEPDLAFLQLEGFTNRYHARSHRVASLSGTRDTPGEIEGMVGASSGFIAACHLVQKVAKTRATVLFLGDTGVGKEMFARTLHRISDRADKPFVAVNCAAIPENLVEAELFGVEKGAFTGAVHSRPGRFERAHGGSIFLDEIGTLNLTAQSKLLRVLQENEIERVGGTQTRKVDVRVVAATNIDLKVEARRGLFRSDLLFRLDVFPVRIPPLRERRDDIPLLMAHFLERFNLRHGRRVSGFTDRAVDKLIDYEYPGNIRELENMIERAVILVNDEAPIDVGHLFASSDEIDTPFFGIATDGNLQAARWGTDPVASGSDMGVIDNILGRQIPLDRLELSLIERAVEKAQGNLSEAARALGLTRPQLAYRYRKTRPAPEGEVERQSSARDSERQSEAS
jgi:two-component system, NtrC family, response regulator HydG